MLISILGPTATGKTTLAARLAYELGAEIISGDSRQVYRGMDLGTGKDLGEYIIYGMKIPTHLIDICEAGEEYNLHRYLSDFRKIYERIDREGRRAILCGGSGMYIEAVLRGFNVVDVPINHSLRDDLARLSDDELREKLRGLGPVHATSDLNERARTISAIEKRLYYMEHQLPMQTHAIPSVNFGIQFPREQLRERITRRLKQRLAEGMAEEVKGLLEKGVSGKQFMAYGLEYRWLTLYATGKISWQEMFDGLNTAIHRFAKRQMTWFRGMERRGISINWLDGNLSLDQKLNIINEKLNKIR
ncbi:MAG TPA: tRNA (adenosine(37)-N6)-dimethylallyltransferase MiaA [Bacteroidales bacterium]|nr:tRNA (adenosine(37)-N6)-dimethylallyltransferase MiaA [Bacteroidales bacterium]HSA42788.1 tRNA (adenosine(37)-N6)-dimethylallyltransferase MiaA [Bacteroidales bacterium]